MQVFLEGFWGKLELHAWLIALGALGQVMGWSCLAGRRETSGRPVVDEQLDQSHAWPHPMGLGLPESLSDTQRQHQQWLVQAGQQGPCGIQAKDRNQNVAQVPLGVLESFSGFCALPGGLVIW